VETLGNHLGDGNAAE